MRRPLQSQVPNVAGRVVVREDTFADNRMRVFDLPYEYALDPSRTRERKGHERLLGGLVSAAGALKARVPTKPAAPAAANKQTAAPDVDPTQDRSTTYENAGYMVAGG
jgi:hypothetical protein